ncbi:hypothetical protein V8G54_014895 [Vigna mungo]|uniref:Uncharacterized protein n=1 Tax=Vigna mungo TaxID=3915 RepID=A0AAQ3NHI0_VIGMU
MDLLYILPFIWRTYWSGFNNACLCCPFLLSACCVVLLCCDLKGEKISSRNGSLGKSVALKLLIHRKSNSSQGEDFWLHDKTPSRLCRKLIDMDTYFFGTSTKNKMNPRRMKFLLLQYCVSFRVGITGNLIFYYLRAMLHRRMGQVVSETLIKGE